MRTIPMTMMATMLLGGCAAFTSPKEQPVIEDTIGFFNGGPISTIAVTPERRVAFVNTTKGTGGRYGNFCAEPPADVAESLTSQFQAALKADAKNIDVRAAAEVGKLLRTAVQALTARSQGLSFYRDSAFRLCELHLNGQVSTQNYLAALERFAKLSHELIMKELELNDGKIGFPSAIEAPEVVQLDPISDEVEVPGDEDPADGPA